MQKQMQLLTLLLLLGLLLSVGCSNAEEATPNLEGQAAAEDAASVPEDGGAAVGPGSGMGPGRGMGPGSGMMERHRARIPDQYASLENPVPVSEESIERGAEVYTTYCATCHGDGGMGDGPAGESLEPPPAPIAHTSQMLGDDYLFWRISEGGSMEPFNSAMPAWGEALSEEQRWDTINYMRALGSGTVTPGRMMGGAMYDPAVEEAQRVEMLDQAIGEGLITQREADVFMDVHAAMDELMAAGMPQVAGGMTTMQQAFLQELVNDGAISREQAEIFSDVHDRLLEAGLMQ